ncbi:hypothetical protein Bca52824_096445 [Brassica carinata]|uniref:Uncharacterized protein n=1 Tax=Brassica carinata TaxID=52824 RepID=A0A8X7NXY6_BRACI|nr:hypothetical protein Bca52824_096445 [Brassica carinata]
MEYILATREREVLVELTKEVRSRGLGIFFSRFASRPYLAPVPYFTQHKKEDLRLLALLLNPIHPLVCKYSCKHPNETAEQLLQLKEQLYDAEREIQRLAERVERGSSNSPISSSVSVEANETPFFGDYNVGDDGDDYDNLFYPVPENIYIDGVEWASLYI